jgi:hypothetical protein
MLALLNEYAEGSEFVSGGITKAGTSNAPPFFSTQWAYPLYSLSLSHIYTLAPPSPPSQPLPPLPFLLSKLLTAFWRWREISNNSFITIG